MSISMFQNAKWASAIFQIRGMLARIFLPLGLLGLLLYFFIFQDFNDERLLDQSVRTIDRLFLPLIAPEPPLDRYNLLSWNHLFDFLNAIWLWSPIALLAGSWLLVRKKVSLSPPAVALLLTLLLMTGFLFMVNPLVSMPMDWDLFCFPAPVLLVLLLSISKAQQDVVLPNGVLAGSLALALMLIPPIWVNHQTAALSQRVETVGRHIFKTYYAHSSTYLLFSLQLETDVNVYRSRKESIIADLQPWATPGRDINYSDLLIDQAILEAEIQQNYPKARSLFLNALDYRDDLGEYASGLEMVNQRLIEQGYTFSEADRQRALAMAERAKGPTENGQSNRIGTGTTCQLLVWFTQMSLPSGCC